ncbi:MAG: ATP-dependent helicase [Gemmatimonadetes bacterium]|nr:ATP-dependent helicase [Gemmatimonadota bacterium]
MPSTDEVQLAEKTRTAEHHPARGSAVGPAQFVPGEVPLREQKGRGLAVFRCPGEFSMPEIESRPGTAVLCDPKEGQDMPGEPDRLVLKLSSRRAAHMNSLVNLLVLPAYRRYIPLYLFASWDLQDLDTGSVGMPDKDEIEDAMSPLLREQLRFLLACTCAVFPTPDAVHSSEEPWLTPVERKMHEGLARAGLSHKLHAPFGSCFVDLLVDDARGSYVAVEVDGREFVRDGRSKWDQELTRTHNIRDVIRFNGSEVVHDLDGCIDRVRSNLAGNGRGRGTVLPMPEPNPGLAGEQARCLDPRAGVVLTLAPAGSGKTRVLTRRVVEAVRGGVRPGRILCVVFNKAASEVMSERIHGDAGLPDVHIRTLHSLGFEICRQAPESPYAGYGVVTEQSLPGGLTDLYRKALKEDFRRHFPAIPYPFPEHLVTAYEEAVSRYRRTLMPIDEYGACEGTESFDRRQVLRMREEVERRMSEKALMTFDEQLFRAVEILLSDPRARTVYQHRFDSVLVDEVQDLTPVQFLMLRLLSLPLNNLFAVGDDDQMINTFTGADPENIRSFQRWYPGAAIHTLGANYRCGPEIVTRSASVISHNANRFDKPIRPVQVGSDRNTIRIHKCPSLEAETDAVVRTIRRWSKLGYAFRDMAVLVRVQSIAPPLQSALKEADLPFHPLDEGALYQTHVGRTVGAYVDVVAHGEKADPLSYAISLSFPSRQLSNARLREAAALGPRFLAQKDSLPGDANDKLDEYRGCIESLRVVYGAPGVLPVDFLDTLMDQSGLATYYLQRDETSRQRMTASGEESIGMIRQMAARYPTTDSFVGAYLRSMASGADADPEEYDRYGASQAERGEQSAYRGDTARDSAQPESTVDGHAHDGGTAGDGEQPAANHSDVSPAEDRITVTTIHRSKGDEFKGVILFHVVEDILPHRRMTGSEEQIEEERRVFYVALTRAEERLCITTQRKRPSRFLSEMEPASGVDWLKRVRDRLTLRS